MTEFVTEQARRMRIDPDQLARQLADSGQLGSVASEVLRNKALDVIAQRAKVTDEAGREVDLAAASGPGPGGRGPADEAPRTRIDRRGRGRPPARPARPAQPPARTRTKIRTRTLEQVRRHRNSTAG